MRLSAAIAIGASVAVLAAAQDQQPPTQPPPPVPTFRAEANYVRVDVYPTKDGAPITDLTQADFEVLENGVPQRVEQFERVQIRAAGPMCQRPILGLEQ